MFAGLIAQATLVGVAGFVIALVGVVILINALTAIAKRTASDGRARPISIRRPVVLAPIAATFSSSACMVPGMGGGWVLTPGETLATLPRPWRRLTKRSSASCCKALRAVMRDTP